VVYPLINNYKAQRNVRAELSGAVDLGEPVSLYIKEDEVKYGSKNLILNGSFTDNVDNWTNSASRPWDSMVASSGKLSAVVENGGGYASILSNKITFKKGSQYQIKYTVTKTSGDTLKVNVHPNTSITDSSNGGSMYSEEISGTETNTAIFTATHTEGYVFLWVNASSDSDSVATLDNVSVYEVVDHTYKLMAINDTIPSGGINVEAEGSEMISNDRNQIFDEAGQWAQYNSPTSAGIVSEKFQVVTTGSGTEGATLPVANLTAPVVGRTYRIRAKLDNVDGANLDATYKFSFGGTSETITASDGTPNNGMITTSEEEYYADVVAANTDGNLAILIPNAANDEATTFTIDDVSVKEVLGYDYYNAPAYKFGIVSSVYDQSTGAMKTTGAAGDEVDVTVQGECTIIFSTTTNKTKDYLIGKIATDGGISQYAKTSDSVLPNAVGVITEDVSSSTNIPIILFQGVEFSEHFVHKNSLQVIAKCDETITKFRPVSLFLDSNGDLLCRHDDIPEQAPDSDTDHTGVDPGKWGVAELEGVSGELIPVTVAGKTTISTAASLPEAPAGNLIQRIAESGWIGNNSVSNNFTPNALGVIMETGGGGDEVPITIFGGTPIGTITDWKRTIKVTAKANGAITQYCPVSLYLDANGNYKCISDDIPNTNTDSSNGIWCDFRKWGIAQEAVADGENVEIIVQGRTNVVNSLAGANREEYVIKISSSGVVTATDSGGYQLSMLGIVEKEARTSDGQPGTIIIF